MKILIFTVSVTVWCVQNTKVHSECRACQIHHSDNWTHVLDALGETDVSCNTHFFLHRIYICCVTLRVYAKCTDLPGRTWSASGTSMPWSCIKFAFVSFKRDHLYTAVQYNKTLLSSVSVIALVRNVSQCQVHITHCCQSQDNKLN